MRTLRNTGSVRMVGVALALLIAGVSAGCGSSSPTTSTASSSTSSPSPSTAATALAPSTSTAPSSPSVPSTIPRSSQASCAALASALSVSDLRLRNSGNWAAERQRILVDTASNVELFSTAANGVPAEVARALEKLKVYSTWLGDTVANATSFGEANSAANAYPDSAGVANAAAVVDEWKRANC